MFKGLKHKEQSERSGRQHAQTFVEYTLVLGLIAAIFMAMSPMIKRASQGMVKVVADQIGAQENAEQSGNLSAWLVLDETAITMSSQVHEEDILGTTGKVYDRDNTWTNHRSEVNGGFSDTGFSPLFTGY